MNAEARWDEVVGLPHGHHGGVPKGKVWRKIADESLWWAQKWHDAGKRSFRDDCLRVACHVVYAHARKSETRAEAQRLLAVLEANP